MKKEIPFCSNSALVRSRLSPKSWVQLNRIFFLTFFRILGQNVSSSSTMKTECILLWNPFSLKIPVNGESRWVSISWTLPDLINFSELFMSLSLDPVKIFGEKVSAILASMFYSKTNSSVNPTREKRQSHLQFQPEIRKNYEDDLSEIWRTSNWKLYWIMFHMCSFHLCIQKLFGC